MFTIKQLISYQCYFLPITCNTRAPVAHSSILLVDTLSYLLDSFILLLPAISYTVYNSIVDLKRELYHFETQNQFDERKGKLFY